MSSSSGVDSRGPDSLETSGLPRQESLSGWHRTPTLSDGAAIYNGGRPAICPGEFLGGGELPIFDIPGAARSVPVLACHGSRVRGQVCGVLGRRAILLRVVNRDSPRLILNERASAGACLVLLGTSDGYFGGMGPTEGELPGGRAVQAHHLR